MAKKLHVGNLGFDTTEDDLQELFARVGEVLDVQIVSDRDTGRSLGFGFVEMNDRAAEKALAQLNGTRLNGRNLNVTEAHRRANRRMPG
ncbi:RNA-binding protein [Streptomyces sp. XD-27]|uniref:RNA recognition motif domain-containing protein n=1 Tax=Streptomyces sp. XD-27 TaxID=3062779 RepID=UPI0026F413DA|nr:RNA-binding protein [Streptomyces sp. XD-27]WKX71105.1 RNA-binding protein [Streptomyces sp. XD-27]